MSRFNWSDVYPGHRMVTLVLDEALAEEFLAQVADEGMLIAKDVVRGLPLLSDRSQGGDAAAPSPSSSQRSTSAEPAAPRALASARTASRSLKSDRSQGGDAAAPSREKSRTAGRPLEDDEQISGDLAEWRALGHKSEKHAPEPLAKPRANIFILPVIQRERMDAEPKNDAAPPPKAKMPAKPKRPSSPSLEPVETRSNRRSILDEKPPERDVPATEPAVRYFAGKGPVRRGEVTKEDRAMVAAALENGTVKVTKCPPGHARADYHQTGSDWGTISGNERQKAKRHALKQRREANHGNG